MRFVIGFLLFVNVLVGQSVIEAVLCDGDFEIDLRPEEENVTANYYHQLPDATVVDNRFLYSIASAGTYEVQYKLTNEFGCVSYGISVIMVEDCPYWSFYAANAFTPNEDSHNNTWFPKYENVYIKSLEIFNRWGELIYNKVEPWDGENAQDDVYAYRVLYIANGKTYESVGRISVIR
jgi:gliding motility-associated-like protein